MIYLEKGEATATTGSEYLARYLEKKQGFTRVEGRKKKLKRVFVKAVKESFLGFAIPLFFASLLFHLCGGQDNISFIVGIILFSIMHDLLTSY